MQKKQESEKNLQLIKDAQELTSDLIDYEPTFPLNTTKTILKSTGFQSNDENTYKILNAMSEQFANDIIQSIMNLKSHKMKNPEKNKKRGAFKLTLDDLLSELKERDISVFKTKYFVGSTLNDEFIDKLAKKKQQNENNNNL